MNKMFRQPGDWGTMDLKQVWFFLFLVTALLFVTSCSPVDETPGPGEEEILPGTPPGDPLASPAAAADHLLNLGEGVYLAQCAECHQFDGSGTQEVYPALAGNPVVTGDPIPVIEIVIYGRGDMPPFGGILTVEEIASVVSFIRNAWTNQATFVTSEQVEAAR
jgi:mono/diheme cytochrome c family protein